MKHMILIVALLGLAGCGADGDPITPSANVGIGVGSHGTTINGSVGATNGPVAVRIGRGGLGLGLRL